MISTSENLLNELRLRVRTTRAAVARAALGPSDDVPLWAETVLDQFSDLKAYVAAAGPTGGVSASLVRVEGAVAALWVAPTKGSARALAVTLRRLDKAVACRLATLAVFRARLTILDSPTALKDVQRRTLARLGRAKAREAGRLLESAARGVSRRGTGPPSWPSGRRRR